MFNRIKEFGKRTIAKIKRTVEAIRTLFNVSIRLVLAETRAESYVDTGVKILIAVVIGALLLALLYALFNDTVMPSVTERVNELFNYQG